MLRGIGYVLARRNPDDPEEPRDWALFIEALFRGLLARFAALSLGARGPQPQDRESASAKRSR
jgi:hypothetical protein